MASSAGEAPSTGWDALQTSAIDYMRRRFTQLESWLEAERAQLPLWLPVMLGVGVASWFVFPLRSMWTATLLLGAAISLLGLAIGLRWRTGTALLWTGLALSWGCGLVWIRAETRATAQIARPEIIRFSGTILATEPRRADDQWRVRIAPDTGGALPSVVRITMPLAGPRPQEGGRITVRARLVPPPGPLLPGGYDFRRASWFMGIGAVGTALDPPILGPPPAMPPLRARLAAHIEHRLASPAQGIALALATGEQGQIRAEDQAAMRTSGLAHLLSVSGLHISAVVAAAFFLCLRLLALSSVLARTCPLLIVAAGGAALAGVGYTLLTGAEVPTIRACVAALLVLVGLAMGREAMTLRLVASGALFILFLWPEALIGPSFQLSFAAITAIVALHDSPLGRRLFSPRDERWFGRFARHLAALLLTGVAVEISLMPIALFHFHKSGLYGALANLIAIPLTTFVIMPAEALALVADVIGLGAPFWWLTGVAIELLLTVAHRVAGWPGGVAMLPAVSVGAYALILIGGLWLVLWRHHVRLWGLLPLSLGSVWALASPTPDLLVTRDGQHLAVRDDAGQWAILRPRAGEFVRQSLAERAAYPGDLPDLDIAQAALCTPDACSIRVRRGGRYWHILALRSRHHIRWQALVEACSKADILVSARRLPARCRPRWLRIDPHLLAKTGGLAITLSPLRLKTSAPAQDDHPWERSGSAP